MPLASESATPFEGYFLIRLTVFRTLPGEAHAGLAADAVDVLAEGDVDLDEHGSVAGGVEE
jgi:hypothetical protein